MDGDARRDAPAEFGTPRGSDSVSRATRSDDAVGKQEIARGEFGVEPRRDAPAHERPRPGLE